MNKNISAPSWLTAKADAAGLPALIEKLGTQVDPATVDELWVFPTQRSAGVESTVFVVSVHEEDDRRRVLTSHVRTTRNKRGEPTVEMKVDEQAIAPAERIPRVIEGVLKRMDDFTATPPSYARIGTDPQRWTQLVEVLTNLKPNEALPETLLADTRVTEPAEEVTEDTEAATEDVTEETTEDTTEE